MEINKQSLSDQVYNILKLRILRGEIPFGSKLVNRSLQKEFDLSSSPIRDAINRLNQDGLITAIEKTGAIVVELDYDFFISVNEILYSIVNSGIKLSAKKADTGKVVEKLESCLKQQEKYIGSEKYYDWDYQFHKTFIDYTGNPMLKKLFKEYNVLHEILVRYFYKSDKAPMQKESLKMHGMIIRAYKSGDYLKAIELNEEHYLAAERAFQESKINARHKN